MARVIDLIDHAVVADANPPEIACASKLLATWRPRIVLQGFDAREDTSQSRIGKPFQFLASRAYKLNRVLRHSASVGQLAPNVCGLMRAIPSARWHAPGRWQHRRSLPKAPGSVASR